MSNLLQIQNASKSFGARTLLESCTFAVNEGEHIGVIGPNGAGKSTLFKVIVGLESLDAGLVTRSQSLRLGYLAQEDNWNGCVTVESFLEKNCRLPIWDLYRMAHDLGISQEQLKGPITNLSGGYRMRVKLVHLIGNEPNLMLLDEPTNYLDLETLLVLEQFLLNYSGAVLLISHDREFLKRVTDHTLEIEGGQVTKFNGNIDDYFEQKQMLEEQLQARAMSLAQQRGQILEFAARFGAKATKARQAQSRLKRLDKMEQIEVRALPMKARIILPPPVRTGQLVGALERADLGYGTHVVLKGVHFQLKRGDHTAVVGVNGAGKSTLLKALSGLMKPLTGERVINAEVGYYAQHVSEGLNPEFTVFQGLQQFAHPDVSRQEILNLAASLLFSGEDVDKKIKVLSGGEKSRVALGQILLKKSPCLILDEPTNHLDFNTVEALTQALHEYDGTLVLVSHDRGFVRRVATRILEIRDGRADFYPGTYDEYVWSLQKGYFGQKASEAGTIANTEEAGRHADAGRAVTAASTGNFKEQRKLLDKKIRQLDKEIEAHEANSARLEQELLRLNDELLAATGEKAQQAGRDLADRQTQLHEVEQHWMSALEEKEQCALQLQALLADA